MRRTRSGWSHHCHQLDSIICCLLAVAGSRGEWAKTLRSIQSKKSLERFLFYCTYIHYSNSNSNIYDENVFSGNRGGKGRGSLDGRVLGLLKRHIYFMHFD